MPSIKTRESLRTIKTFDRAKTLGQKVKNGAGEIKEYGEELQNTRYGSANEYAGNAVENTERRTARNVAYGAGKIGNWGLKETRKNILKWRNRQKKFKVKVQQPKQLPAHKRPALPPAKTTAKTAQKGVKTAQRTAKAAAKTAKVTVKAAQKAAQAAKAAAKVAVKFAKVAAKAIVAAVKATVAAIKGIVAAIAAGGWIAVAIILLICLVALVLCSAFGVFAPSADGEYSIGYVVSEAKNEYNRAIAEITSASPHDYVVMDGELAPMKEVIAVFAVRANAEGDELMTMDEAKKDQFLLVFWGMNTIRAYTEEKVKIEIVYETDADGNTVEVQREKTEVYLHIETSHLTAEQGAEVYSFTDKQRETMREMLDSYFDDMWDAVLSEAR